jgi:hypothetical protein
MAVIKRKALRPSRTPRLCACWRLFVWIDPFAANITDVNLVLTLAWRNIDGDKVSLENLIEGLLAQWSAQRESNHQIQILGAFSTGQSPGKNRHLSTVTSSEAK